MSEEVTKEEKKEEEEVQTPKVKKNRKLKWYIIKGSGSREKSIAELIKQRAAANELSDKITEVVVPTKEKVVIKRGKKQTINERIYPGYILVQMEVTDETLHLIRNTEDVQGFIGYSQVTKKPKPISEREARGILALMEVKQDPVHQADFAEGDAVKVTGGTWKEFIGTVQEVNTAKGQATVLLSIFGRETPVTLEFRLLEKI